MVYEIFFCSEFLDISDKAGRKTRRKRRTQVISKRCAFHAKAIVVCYLTRQKIL